jgi:hypothetical protein
VLGVMGGDDGPFANAKTGDGSVVSIAEERRCCSPEKPREAMRRISER